ncbi:ubiquitin conjugation factor, putative [Eimeria necatrix]|uniref:RING-type E3 ubiquitin transferase n=1 Tax=Eimeria necatrix TaxID=51315 RepID=U6MW47_9EIME|nr:ubiquitin conjugation factor, putative [Eimeria necatrix]CDJ68181.1 ubiquitin conjugation factor, putative [Eimeria necatrix]
MESPQATGAVSPPDAGSGASAAPPGEPTAAATVPSRAEEAPKAPAAAAAATAAPAAAAAAGTRPAMSPEEQREIKEDRFLQASLRVRADGGVFPNCLYLPKLAEECVREGLAPRLRVDVVQEILIEQTQLLWRSKSQNVFRANAEAFHRLSDDTYTKYLPADRRVAATAAVQEQLVSNAVLLLTCLELFELEEPPPVAAVSVQFREFLEGGASTVFMNKLIAGLQDTPTAEEALAAAFGPAVDGFFAALTGRAVGDYKAPAVGAIRFLSSFKPIAAVIANRPCFSPPFLPPLPASQPGFFLQENSLLGRLLSFTPLDGPVLPKGQQSSVQRAFAGSAALAPTYLQNTIQGMRHDIQNLMDIDNQILKNLCRAGKAERQRVLLWFAAVLTSNEGRAKAAHAHMLLQQQTPESADPLHSFLIKAQGQNTFGFCINVFHALLLLVDPIKYEKICELSPFYVTCGPSSDALRLAVAGPLRREALLGEGEAVAAAKAFYQTIAADDANSKFTAEVFWLTIRAVRLCFNPCANECMRWMDHFQRRHDEGMQQNSTEAKHIIAEVLGWRVILLHPRLCSLYWHFAHLFCSWLLGCMYTYAPDGKEDPKAVALLTSQKWRYAALLTQLPPGGAENPSQPPPQFALLPSGIIEDLFLSMRHMAELQAVYSSLRGAQGGEVSPCSSMDAELVAATCIAVMGSPGFFRSVHTRCDGACRTLHRLFLLEDFRSRLESLSVAKRFLLPALFEVFIDSERGSYYDRINFRIPIVDMLRRLLANEDYKTNMKGLAEAHPEKFLHLIHLLLNDVAALVDQAMEALVEIRRRQLEGRDNDQAPLPGQTGARAGAAGAAAAAAGATQGAPAAGGEEEESDGDEVAGSLEGQSPLEREPWARLQTTARDLCSLGQSACGLFTLLSRHCGAVISSSSSVLPQAVTTLDCCLDHLVGPRCLQLKVNSMETYSFRPKDWLSTVLEAYVYLLQADKTNGEVIIAEILRDGRYYKQANISKACRIARREGLMSSVLLEEFHSLVKRLADMEQAGKDIDLDDVPPEFLDPIMADLMTDPVLLPSSKVIVDRRNIERHLMSEPSDPFNRAPLTREQLVPQPELKKAIEAFTEAKRQMAATTKSPGN